MKLAMIALGGAAGALLRFGVVELMKRLGGDTFPVGTLVVNAIGCLAVGLIAGLIAGRLMSRDDALFALLVIGLLGGFTTFSAFGWETFELLNQKQFMRAGLYVLLSNGLGLAGVWAGFRFAAAFLTKAA
jgi:CrcB protein